MYVAFAKSPNIEVRFRVKIGHYNNQDINNPNNIGLSPIIFAHKPYKHLKTTVILLLGLHAH